MKKFCIVVLFITLLAELFYIGVTLSEYFSKRKILNDLSWDLDSYSEVVRDVISGNKIEVVLVDVDSPKLFGTLGIMPLRVDYYVVAEGDTLYSVAESHHIKLDTLIGCNTFKVKALARLVPGTVMRIPNQEGIFYVMNKGEDVRMVCRRYGVDISVLPIVTPDIDIFALRNGDEIFLPGAKPISFGSSNKN